MKYGHNLKLGPYLFSKTKRWTIKKDNYPNIKEIPSEEGLGIAKSPEGPKLDPHF